MWLKLISFASNLRCCLSWEVPTPSVDLHRHAWLSHAIETLQDCSLKLWNQSDKYGRLYSSMRQKNSWWTHPNLASIGNITAGNIEISLNAPNPKAFEICVSFNPVNRATEDKNHPNHDPLQKVFAILTQRNKTIMFIHNTTPSHQQKLPPKPSTVLYTILHFAHFFGGGTTRGTLPIPWANPTWNVQAPKAQLLDPCGETGGGWALGIFMGEVFTSEPFGNRIHKFNPFSYVCQKRQARIY